MAVISQYENMIEDSELSYIGEENVNDFSTYVLESEEEEATSRLWFDQEAYFEVRSDAEADVDIEGDDINEGLEEGFELNTTEEVLDYEVNPQMDDELFTVPDDMEVVDGDLEDIEVE